MPTIPLSEQLRPQTLEEVVGQPHLVGKNGFLTRIIAGKKPLSLIFWGPPGCGKTTIARLYAKAFDARFTALSAVFSGVAEIKKIINEAENSPLYNKHTLLFVDEIHRFNKAQQDAFLPYLEKGTLILVGATTENPSFSLNNALLSRVRIVTLNTLDISELEKILERYESTRKPLLLTTDTKTCILKMAAGDGRYLLNMIENLEQTNSLNNLSAEEIAPLLQSRAALFDKAGDNHFNLISALHKSVRGSDPDAALYWFARILEGGEDPNFLARRLIRMAVEDIGLADPEALKLAIAARDSYQMLGSPEGELGLAELVVYLSLAPKSNSIYIAYTQAKKLSQQTNHLPPPKCILNAPTQIMKDLGFGKGYCYDHSTESGFSGQNYFPDKMQRPKLFQPVERGFERELKKRLAYFNNLGESLKEEEY